MSDSQDLSRTQRLLSRIKTLIFYALIFIVAGFVGNLWMTQQQASGMAPPLSINAINTDQQPLPLSQRSNPQLVYFFAEWCGVCKLQNHVIRSISDDYDVLGIAMQSGNDEQVMRYVTDKEFSFPVINDQDGRITEDYGVKGVPAAFVIDQHGQIRHSTRGYATEIGLRIRLWLAQS